MKGIIVNQRRWRVVLCKVTNDNSKSQVKWSCFSRNTYIRKHRARIECRWHRKLMCSYLKAKKAKLVNFCNLSPPTRPISLALNSLSFPAKPPPSHLPSVLSPAFPSGRNVKRRFFYIPCNKTSPWLCRCSEGSSISTTPVSVPT